MKEKLPTDPAKRLVRLWKMFEFFAKYPASLDQQAAAMFQTYIAQAELAYFGEAVKKWKPEMLTELAAEMKRAKDWEPDRIDYALEDLAKQGPVNLSELEREAAKRKFVIANRRTWKRRADKLGIKARDAGAPPK